MPEKLSESKERPIAKKSKAKDEKKRYLLEVSSSANILNVIFKTIRFSLVDIWAQNSLLTPISFFEKKIKFCKYQRV